MGFEFNPLVWYICKLCRQTFPDPDKLKAHKLADHLEDCPGIKCVIFEERFLDHEWFPPDFQADQNQNRNQHGILASSNVPLSPEMCIQNPSVALAQAQVILQEPKPAFDLNSSIFEPSSSSSSNERQQPLTSSASFLVEEEYSSEPNRAEPIPNIATDLSVSIRHNLGHTNPAAVVKKDKDNESDDSDEDKVAKAQPDSPLESLSPCSSNDGLNGKDGSNEIKSPEITVGNGSATSTSTSTVPTSVIVTNTAAAATGTTLIPIPTATATLAIKLENSTLNSAVPKTEEIIPPKPELVTRGTQTSASVLQYEYLETLKAYQNALDKDANEDDDDEADFQDADIFPTSFLQQTLTIPDKVVQIPESSRAPVQSSMEVVKVSFKGRILRPKMPKVVKVKPDRIEIVPVPVPGKRPRGRPRKIRTDVPHEPQFTAAARSLTRKTIKSKPYKCQVCGACFRKQNFLLNHQVKTHGEEKKRPFRCPHCPAALTSKPGLKRHMIVHGKDTKHKCRFCGKSFNFKNVLQDHERTHTGERPFKCQVRNCEDSFTSKTALNMHTRRKHREELGLQQFVCPTCKRAFGLKSELNYHIMQVHQSTTSERFLNVFKCQNDPCKCVYKTKQELDDHLKDCLFIY